MAVYALIDAQGVITNRIVLDDPADFPPPSGLSLVAGAEGYAIGGSIVGGAYTPPATAPVPPVDLAAYAMSARWKKETGGISVGGVPLATDDRAKLMIVGARVAADADANWSTVWQGADGNAYPVNAVQMIAISNAVQAHVANCFAIFATVKGSIDNGSITTTTQIDAAFA
jgi:hypothetical protein